jgi:hypothetical protein
MISNGDTDRDPDSDPGQDLSLAGGTLLTGYDFDLVRRVRHHAQKLERGLKDLVVVRNSGRDKQNVALADFVHPAADPDLGAAAEHVLLMLNRVGMHRHPSTIPHDESPHGEIRSLVRRSDKYLHLRRSPRGHISLRHFFGMFYRSCLFLLSRLFVHAFTPVREQQGGLYRKDPASEEPESAGLLLSSAPPALPRLVNQPQVLQMVQAIGFLLIP